MARADAVCTLFVGVGRSGKSFQQVWEMVNVWLPDESGPIWTNLPLHADKVAEFVSKRTGKPAAEYAARIHVIPEEELELWRATARDAAHDQDVDEWYGPWSFFAADREEINNIVGGRIVLDEAHHYWPFGGCVKFQKEWQKWVGELGHANCQLRLLTQDYEKLSECAPKEAAMKYEVVNSETERDPAFGILLKDWYELIAAFTGVWMAACWVRENRKEFGKQVPTDWQKYRFDKRIFALYESHAKPIAGGQAAAGQYQREYQKRNPLGVLVWFLRRNGVRLFASKSAWKVVFVLFLCFGGMGWIFHGIQGQIKSAMTVGAPQDVKKKTEQAAAVVPKASGTPAVQPRTISGQSPNLIPDQGFQEDWIGEKLSASSNPERVAALTEELRQLRESIAAGSEVMALTSNKAVLRDGAAVGVGEEIPSGPFAGVHISEIRFDRREVRLADGRLLRIGWHNKRLSAPVDDGSFSTERPAVPESVPRAIRRGEGEEAYGDERERNNGRGGWYDTKRLRPVPREGAADKRGDVGGPGQQGGQPRSLRSPGSDGPVDGGPSSGS